MQIKRLLRYADFTFGLIYRLSQHLQIEIQADGINLPALLGS